MIEIEAKHTAD